MSNNVVAHDVAALLDAPPVAQERLIIDVRVRSTLSQEAEIPLPKTAVYARRRGERWVYDLPPGWHVPCKIVGRTTIQGCDAQFALYGCEETDRSNWPRALAPEQFLKHYGKRIEGSAPPQSDVDLAETSGSSTDAVDTAAPLDAVAAPPDLAPKGVPASNEITLHRCVEPEARSLKPANRENTIETANMATPSTNAESIGDVASNVVPFSGRLDTAAAGAFLEKLDSGGSLTFQTFDDDKQRKDGRLAHTLHGQLPDLASQLESLNRQGAGIFVTVNAVRNGAPRTSDNVTRVRALFVDLDGAPLQPVLDWTLPPHLVVESSPGKFHAYWRVDDVPLDQFGTLQKKLAALFDGDHVHDLPRVLRLPGSWHQKVSRDGVRSTPFKAVVTRQAPRGATYGFAEFKKALADVELPERDRREPRPPATTARGRVNEVALGQLRRWADAAFPDGRWQASGAYRVSSRALLQPDYEEDLSIHPREGIRDFGSGRSFTPIGVLAEFCTREKDGTLAIAEPDADGRRQNTLTADQAEEWLADVLGMDLEKLKQEEQPASGFVSVEIAERPKPADQNNAESEKPILALTEWLSRDLPEPDYIMGRWLTTTSRVVLNAATGLGKSMLVIGLGMSGAAGNDFLHWAGVRPATILYIDGEMSRRLLKQRLAAEVRRLGSKPQGFHALSHEDIENFAPLNTKAGQDIIDREIKRIDSVDLVIFDNIMSLIAGDMKDEESWRQTLPWIRNLTARRIGQLWVHHTGHDESRGYGTSTREWQMDTVIQLDRVKRADTDVSFQVSFPKGRERTPATRTDFADAKIALLNDTWTWQSAEGRGLGKITPTADKFLGALRNATKNNPDGGNAPFPFASLEAWKNECFNQGLIERDKDRSASSMLSKYKIQLIAANYIACDETTAQLRV